MPRKRRGRPRYDDRPAVTEPLVVETMETLSGPGPCEKCSGPKFDHVPFGGISHPFKPRDPMFRAIQAAKNSERRGGLRLVPQDSKQIRGERS